MAIYHLEAKMVSRGAGRSAVAAAAYLSCSRMLNEYDGVQHDYTRKQGLGWRQVFLPATAPAEWQDREALWNAVEEAETAKDSRLAREFVAALPIELSREEQIQLLQDFIKEQFVADGMCADAAIHDPYPPGHNPHAHILLTVRPLDEKGKWQYKTEKEYLCVKDGEERGFTAAEFKQAQADGWEKQYQYKVGKKKVYMAPSAAQAQGYERVSKYPKSTKFGRQNPITERWNSDEQLVLWRAAWADVANRHLERTGHEERIDHRSHAERGLLERPTVHEGVVARAMEKKGIISDRCELNRQIKADNALLRELRGQVKKLAQTVKNTIPALAEAMENLRKNLLLFCYQLGYLRKGKERLNASLNTLRPALTQYNQLAKDIRDKTKERRSLLSEKKSLSAVHVFRHRELAAKIAALTEDLEELCSEKNLLLASLAYYFGSLATGLCFLFRLPLKRICKAFQKGKGKTQSFSWGFDSLCSRIVLCVDLQWDLARCRMEIPCVRYVLLSDHAAWHAAGASVRTMRNGNAAESGWRRLSRGADSAHLPSGSRRHDFVPCRKLGGLRWDRIQSLY